MTEPSSQVRSESDISDWLIDSLSKLMDCPPGDVMVDESVTSLGIDSMQYVGLIGDLEEWLGCRFTDNPLIDYPSVQTLSAFVAAQLKLGKTEIDPFPESS